MSTQEENIFSKRTFQEKVIQALILDKFWAQTFIEILNINESFDYAPLKVLAKEYIGHYRQYKEFPSNDLLKIMIGDTYANPQDMVLKTQALSIIEKIEKGQDVNDLAWVKDKAFEFCKQQNLKKALVESASLVGTDQYEKVIEIMKEAIAAGTPNTSGHDYLEDFDARYSETYRNCIATKIPKLDDKNIMNGGLGSGELGIVVAPSGTGKTHCLIHLAASALLQQKNVIYYTLELSERLVGLRFDSHLCNIPNSECAFQKEEIKNFLKDLKDNNQLGRLIIKEYPVRSTTVNTIRNHIERQTYKGFKTDLIVVDYAGILRSAEKLDLPRLEMQYIIQDLRKLAKELMIPVWTALQANREGAKAEVIDITELAESFGPAMDADFIIGLQRPRQNRQTGFGNIFIAKNRFGIDGIKFPIHLDTSKSKLTVLDVKEESDDDDESDDGEQLSSKARILMEARKSIEARKKNNKLIFSPITSNKDY